MLEMEVTPGRSLGCDHWEFVLGMHFSQAVAIVQSQVGSIKGVQVIYSDMNPLEVDIVINLPQDGVRLVFDPVCQRLKIIEVYNMKLLKLKYCGLIFNSPEILPSIEQIEHCFGATHPGVYDTEKQLFVLNFLGLSFYFPVEVQGCSPLVSRLCLFNGASPDQSTAPELPTNCFQRQVYLQSAEVVRSGERSRGLRLRLVSEGCAGRRGPEPERRAFTRLVLLGDACQDVVTALGAPSRVFYKSEDKMKIHSPSALRTVAARRSDYFFNYFTMGIDILMDARSHTVKKFILHTNYPGHYNFNMYHRCEFRLRLPRETGRLLDLGSLEVTAYTRWDEVCRSLRPSDRPVVLNRASSTNATNPFGSTFCYGYQDLIFEVMHNNHIASLSFYAQ